MLSRQLLQVCSDELSCKVNGGECLLRKGDDGLWLNNPKYLAIAGRISGDASAASDIVSEAYLSIRDKPIADGGQFCRVLRIAVARQAVDHLRRRIRGLGPRPSGPTLFRQPVDPAVCKELRELILKLKQACADKYGKGRGDLFIAYSLADQHGRKQVIAASFGLTLTAASHRVRRLKRRGIERFAAAWVQSMGYTVEEIARLLLECEVNGDA